MSYVCVSCNKTVDGNPHCLSCGAQHLHDLTFISLMQRVDRQNAKILRLEEKVVQAVRHLERACFFQEADEIYDGIRREYKIEDWYANRGR